jgi:hypothetical protein
MGHQRQLGSKNEVIDDDKTAFATWWIAHELEPQEFTFNDCTPPAPLED